MDPSVSANSNTAAASIACVTQSSSSSPLGNVHGVALSSALQRKNLMIGNADLSSKPIISSNQVPQRSYGNVHHQAGSVRPSLGEAWNVFSSPASSSVGHRTPFQSFQGQSFSTLPIQVEPDAQPYIPPSKQIAPPLKWSKPDPIHTFSYHRIKRKDEDLDEEPNGHKCNLCKRNLSYPPEGTIGETDMLPASAVLPCGHTFHDFCLDRITPPDMADNPPCIPCAIGED